MGSLEKTTARSKTLFNDWFNGRAEHGSNSLVGKNVVPECLTDETGFKQRSRRCKLVAGAKDDRFKALVEWGEMREPMLPTIAPDARCIFGAEGRPGLDTCRRRSALRHGISASQS